MQDQSPQDRVVALKVAVFASVSLAIMIGEYLLLIRNELKYVWPKLFWSWTPWIYLFTRYLGLASQAFNVYFTTRMYLGIDSSAAGCRFWFIFQALVIQFLLASVEGLIMHRIYALFLRNKMILLILIMFILGQTVSMWVSARLSFPTNHFTSTCMMVRSNPGGAFFSATTMTTNVAISIMTFWRYLRLPAQWTQEGLGRTVFRDSACTLAAISLMMLFLTLCSLHVINPHTSGNATYYWFVAILWIAIGRIIVNHEEVRQDSSGLFDGSWFETLQITSQIELGEHTLMEEFKHVQSRQRAMSSKMSSPSASSEVTQLSSPSSPYGQEWVGDRPRLDEPRQSPRRKTKPVLYLDIHLTRESDLSPWSIDTSDGAGQMVEADAKDTGEVPTSEVELSGGGVDDKLQAEDITDAWRGEFADSLSSIGPSSLELPPSDVSA